MFFKRLKWSIKDCFSIFCLSERAEVKCPYSEAVNLTPIVGMSAFRANSTRCSANSSAIY